MSAIRLFNYLNKISKLLWMSAIIIGISLWISQMMFISPASAQIATPPPQNPFGSAETIYFWRISGSDSGIYLSRGNQPAERYSPLDRNTCVGCHTVSSQSGRIAAVLDSGIGRVIVIDMSTGNEIPIPVVYGSYLSWSPDGNQLAVSAGDQDIAIIDLDTQTVTPLNGASDHNVIETMPAWSPDGSSITFIRSISGADGFYLNGNTEIMVLPASGGSPEPFAGVPVGRNYYPAYSPDGRWLAFTHHTNNDDTYSSEYADIYLLPLSGGQAIKLEVNSESSDSWPSWSADGKWLAFNSKREGNYDIFATSIDANGKSGNVIKFPGASSGDFEHLPAWGLPPEIVATPIALRPNVTSTATTNPTETPAELSPVPTYTPLPTKTPTPTAAGPFIMGPLNTCLGPMILPCSWVGLPWWVCLLLFVLMLAFLLVFLRWRRLESQFNRNRPSSPGGFPISTKQEWPEFVPPAPPGILPPAVQPKSTTKPIRTIIMSIGDQAVSSLESVAATFQEVYGNTPETIELLAIVSKPDLKTSISDSNTLVLPLDDEVFRIEKCLGDSSDELLELKKWFNTNSEIEDRGRMRARLSLWVHLPEIRSCFSSLFHKFSRLSGDSLFIYLISSPGDEGSALLPDLAYMVRKESERYDQKLSLQACLILPDSQIYPNDQAKICAQQFAFSAWRELDRFQLTSSHPYPFLDMDEQPSIGGKLFERVFLFSSDRAQANLSGINPNLGIYPSIADSILAWSDPQAQQNWNQMARSVDTRLNQRQTEMNETLYNSIGIFSYVLPMERMVEDAALRFTDGLLEAQIPPLASKMHAQALEALEQTNLPTGIPNTRLIRQIAQRAKAINSNPPVDFIGEQVAELITPVRGNPEAETVLSTIHVFMDNYIPRKIPNSREQRDPEWNGSYNSDIPRLINDVSNVRAQLSDFERWLESSRDEQIWLFSRLLIEHIMRPGLFGRLLSESITGVLSQAEVMSAGKVVAFIQAMYEIIEEQRLGVLQAAESAEKKAKQAGSVADQSSNSLLKQAETTKEKLPKFRVALLEGTLAALSNNLITGALAVLFPQFILPLGIIALFGVVISVLWTMRRAFPKQKIPGLQDEFKVKAQDSLTAEIEANLYRVWAEILSGFVNELDRTAAPFREWVGAAAQIRGIITKQREVLENQCKEAEKIRTRCYLDDDELRNTIFKRFLGEQRSIEAASHLCWSPDLSGKWGLTIFGTQAHPIPLPGTSDTVDDQDLQALAETIACSQIALHELTLWYASNLRQLTAAQALVEWLKPDSVSLEAGRQSTPMIRPIPERQSETEVHRFIYVQADDQITYFDQVIEGFQRVAARRFSQQQATFGNPYRVIVISTLDLIRRNGLAQWETLQNTYLEFPSKRRIDLHVFPAERNACLFESLLREIQLPLRLFSPYGCLILENLRRARAFWLGLSLNLVHPEERRKNLGSERVYVVNIPGVIHQELTEPKDESPSLWDAAIAYVLDECGGNPQIIETELANLASTDSRQYEFALEDAISRIARPLSVNESTRELGSIMQIIVTDELHRLTSGTHILGVL